MYLKLISGIFSREMKGNPFFEEIDDTSKKPILVGINCGGRGSKRLPLDNFIELAKMLSDKNINSELILGPAENELRHGLEEKLPVNCNLLPLTPVNKLKETFNRYAVFVTSDTGPMHLAWALKIPVISIFLDSVIEKYRPLSEKSVVFDININFNVENVFHSIMDILESKGIPA
jgi:ADP-heptose:LPS heptosyltransferase